MEAGTRIISIVGPESTGKSTLAKRLGEHFSAPVVPEFAREYLTNKHGDYQESDLILIAEGQLRSELDALVLSPEVLICDTDILVIQIWQKYKYGRVSDSINNLRAQQQKRFYLLTYPDLEWEPDPLRENSNNRLAIFELYKTALDNMKVEYAVVRGREIERMNSALVQLKSRFPKH
ncbi:MAG: NadR type nicotinamide-nucleotide adenylyltransferase [Flavobacteriales bacterium]|jgi:NadR type nicotinamide-nucleotide adenylyltransferase